jgi:AcrR family transcriptional regulator
MADRGTTSQAREQVLLAAGRLFCEKGYAAVTMRDIAEALNMRQASLYYHAPEGKEQLFVEVIEETLSRYQKGLVKVLSETEPRLGSQLRAVALWLVSQPTLDPGRFFRSDLPALSERSAAQLMKHAHEGFIALFEQLFISAYERGEIRLVDATLVTMTLLSIINVVQEMACHIQTPQEVLVQDMLDILLDGMRRR